MKYSNIQIQCPKKINENLPILCTDILGLINIHTMPGLFVPDIAPVENAGVMNQSEY